MTGHDGLQRLQSLDRGDLNGSHTSISNLQFAKEWGLDQTGNWRGFRQDDDGSGWDLDQRRTANQVNEITDITETTGPSWATPAYNAAGNMTSIPQPADPTASFTATYDAWNRLVKVVDGSDTVAEYQYDGAKRRAVVKKCVSGSLDETRHVYFTEPSRWQVLEERVDSSSAAHQQFVWGKRYIDDCVLRERDTTGNGTLDERLYALQDANWNVTAIIDATGAVQERFAYSAYGTPLFLNASFAEQASSSHKWERLCAGYPFEADVEWYAVRHRVYVPGLGWTQRDALGYADGTNLYEYVVSRPLNKLDPSGLVSAPGSIQCWVWVNVANNDFECLFRSYLACYVLCFNWITVGGRLATVKNAKRLRVLLRRLRSCKGIAVGAACAFCLGNWIRACEHQKYCNTEYCSGRLTNSGRILCGGDWSI